MSRRDERGSGTVLVTAAVSVVLILGMGGLQVGAAASAAHRARSAADLSALAAAAALQERRGDPCAHAVQLAARNAAHLVDCRLATDDSVIVRVRTDLHLAVPGLPRAATASARAGPADALPSTAHR